MTVSIDDIVKRMREAAEKVKSWDWTVDPGPNATEDDRADAAHIAASNPANVLAVLDALDKALRERAEVREWRDIYQRDALTQAEKVAALSARVAELERAAVKAVTPLEALSLSGASNNFGPEVAAGVREGIEVVRVALAKKEAS